MFIAGTFDVKPIIVCDAYIYVYVIYIYICIYVQKLLVISQITFPVNIFIYAQINRNTH